MERKSIKKKKINVEAKFIENCFCLIFSLEKPFHKIIIGCSQYEKIENPKEMAQKVQSVFFNDKRENVYCLEDDIINCYNKFEQIYLKNVKV